MAQHDYVIDNQSFPATRTDINNVLQAIASNNSGASAPSTTYANQFWYETDTNKLYIRNEDNDAWIEVAVLDQANDIVSSITSETLVANIVNERTSGSGVTVDGLLIKDKEIGTTAAPATLQATSLNGGQFSRRNVVTNGAVQVAQRSTSVTGIGASAGYFTVDRFNLNIANTAGRLTMTQTADAPSGFANCIKLDCTTADTSIAANELMILEQRFEGQDLQRFAKGTSDAKEYTVSFYVKGNASATYVVELFDVDNTRQVSKSFSVTTSWARVQLTFPADTTGAFDDDANQSLNMHIWLHAGSDFTSGTLSQTWTSNTNANRAVGVSSFFSSTDNTFFITGLQMEVGSVATEFEHRSFGEELALCQRYYQKSYPQGTSAGTAVADNTKIQFSFGTEGSGIVGYNASLPVVMRANPTTTVYDGDGNSGKVDILSSGAGVTHNQATNVVNGRAEFINVRIFGKTCAGMAFHYEADAEL